MPEAASTVTTVSSIWALLAAALVLTLAVLAAALDGALTARADGSPLSSGLIRPVAATARLLRQRRRRTVAADRPLWRVGGAGLLVVALLMVLVVPLGRWTLMDLDVGVVWFNAMDVAVWALVWLTGWGPNSAYALVGGYRFLAYGLGYELPLMFSIVAPAIAASSLNLGRIAAAQEGLWFAAWMPVSFGVYCLAVMGFAVWGPFTTALGADLAGGAAVELSSVDRLVFLAGRYALLTAGAAFAVPLFLGGGGGPLLPDWVWVIVKTATLLAVLVWLRRHLPAARPDLFLEVGWLLLLPLVLGQDLLVAVVAVRRG